MLTLADINGTIVKSFVACKRQGWLAARKLAPLISNSYIQMGTTLAQNRKSKASRIGNIEIDELCNGEHLIVKEYKKTFSNLEASKMQLLFYMDTLKSELNVSKIDGYIISEETSEKYFVSLDKKNKIALDELTQELLMTVNGVKAPEFEKKELCMYCGHNIYCL